MGLLRSAVKSVVKKVAVVAAVMVGKRLVTKVAEKIVKSPPTAK